jgi:ceramide glucosyltransferase
MTNWRRTAENSVLFTIGWILMALGLAGGCYALAAALWASRLLRAAEAPLPAPPPAVALLKPLHGDEPGLEAALASFLEQDYPAPVQIVFGLQDAADPAHGVVEKLKARFPGADIALVTDPREHGSNRKVSNLVNMMAAARHEVLVLADSDIKVAPDYLCAVVATLSQAGVGLVSCFYRGDGVAGFWSRLAAMGVSYHFLPNTLVGVASGLAHPSFGSTIALRRETLDRIGGFAAFAGLLADDYEIGRSVRGLGATIAYPPLAVAHGNAERSLGELAAHELRWARTIRIVDPAGHWGSIVTHGLGLGLIGASCLSFNPSACAALATILASRLFLKARIDHIVGASAGPFWLLPVRDVLSFGLFIASLTGSGVEWRGSRLRVERSGTMAPS